MQRIDAHQHFWQFDPVEHHWIGDEMSSIRRDFLPEDLEPLLTQHGLDGCVLVQSTQSEAHNDFMLQQAARHPFIKGVVGWIDLQDENISGHLDYYRQFPVMKGFRHVLQGEPDRALMLKPAFMRGIGALKEYNYTYDVLIFPDQLPYARELAAAFPEQPFVIDHIAKPAIRNGSIDGWAKDIEAVAALPNVHCKISGMVTEADWQQWTIADVRPYLDVVVHAFGTDRILFGSDWPVCLVAASYDRILGLVREYFSSFSDREQELFFGGNAVAFYNLN